MILVDSREKQNQHILNDFYRAKVQFLDKQPLKFGDYLNHEKKVVIERKRDLIEFAGNCGKNHARFKRELEKCRAAGYKMYILIEQPMKYEDLPKWKNPRAYSVKKIINGKVREFKPMSGYQIKAICDSWKAQYNITFIFCNKKSSAYIIYNLLS